MHRTRGCSPFEIVVGISFGHLIDLVSLPLSSHVNKDDNSFAQFMNKTMKRQGGSC